MPKSPADILLDRAADLRYDFTASCKREGEREKDVFATFVMPREMERTLLENSEFLKCVSLTPHAPLFGLPYTIDDSVSELELRVPSVIETIADNDPMFSAPRDEPMRKQYFRIGRNALDFIRRTVAFCQLESIENILDLPCGYGRVGRFLRYAYPQADITFCDLKTEMVDFCAETFSGEPLYSKEDLTEVAFASQYDVIWVGSLFTHTSAYKSEMWMKHLCQALRPNGLLVATFHGAWASEYHKKFKMCADAEWDEVMHGYDRFGYGYSPYSSRGIYSVGISASKPSAVTKMAESIPLTRISSYTERGFANNQDVLVIQKKCRLHFERGWDSLPDAK